MLSQGFGSPPGITPPLHVWLPAMLNTRRAAVGRHGCVYASRCAVFGQAGNCICCTVYVPGGGSHWPYIVQLFGCRPMLNTRRAAVGSHGCSSRNCCRRYVCYAMSPMAPCCTALLCLAMLCIARLTPHHLLAACSPPVACLYAVSLFTYVCHVP